MILNQEAKEWCLQELDAEGKQIGEDQFPYVHTLEFTAIDLTVRDGIEFSKNEESNAIETRRIIGKLQPADKVYDQPINYSMFGTDRNISDFYLVIQRIGDEDYLTAKWVKELLEGNNMQGLCIAWGGVATPSDGWDRGMEDSVQFSLYVRPETFARYSEAIAAGVVDQLAFSVGVAGFYSKRTYIHPPENVKVLTSSRSLPEVQEVETPDDCEIVPMRLGLVGYASFDLLSSTKFETPTPKPLPDRSLGEATPSDYQPDSATQVAQRLANVNARVVALLTSLRTVAWIIVVMLFITLVT